jgi:hypothetical protein
MCTELIYSGEGEQKEYENFTVWGEDISVLLHFLASEPSVLSRKLIPGRIIREVKFHNTLKRNVYLSLLEFLTQKMHYEEGKDLILFGYDWRQDIKTTSIKLGNYLNELNNFEGNNIVFLSHSMGSLIVRLIFPLIFGQREKPVY